MAKQRHEDAQNSSSRNTLVVMSIGALLVAGLVGWALTRTVEAPATTPASTATQQFPTTTAATTPGTTGFTTTSPMTTQPVNAPAAQSSPIGDKSTITRIAAEDLRERVNAGEVTLIDVRDANSYAAAHIPGALHIPYATVEANLDTLPKGKDIVFYCT